MTCVWDGLIRALNLKLQPREFCIHIKSNNRFTPDMQCNGKALSEQQMKENMDHISSIDIKDIGKGYYCSGCDPLLLLVGQLYDVSIEHMYMSSKILYENKNAKTTIYIGSNNRHMWADVKKIRKQKKIDKKTR